jgi:hypothetical protein
MISDVGNCTSKKLDVVNILSLMNISGDDMDNWLGKTLGNVDTLNVKIVNTC